MQFPNSRGESLVVKLVRRKLTFSVLTPPSLRVRHGLQLSYLDNLKFSLSESLTKKPTPPETPSVF